MGLTFPDPEVDTVSEMETVLQQRDPQQHSTPPDGPSPPASLHNPALLSVESCIHEIGRIVAERQELRAAAAGAAALEANRKQLADAQARLSQLLIARHLPERDAA